MQHTLTFTLNKKKYVSKPFDFEAFCKINEKHISEDNVSIYRCCQGAVEYMFEGTEATEDILKQIPVAEMAKLHRRAWEFYIEVAKESSKNE